MSSQKLNPVETLQFWMVALMGIKFLPEGPTSYEFVITVWALIFIKALRRGGQYSFHKRS